MAPPRVWSICKVSVVNINGDMRRLCGVNTSGGGGQLREGSREHTYNYYVIYVKVTYTYRGRTPLPSQSS